MATRGIMRRNTRGTGPRRVLFHIAATHILLQDANEYQQKFSSDAFPTLHRVIPALEGLLTRWERKLVNPKFSIFRSAIKTGLSKLNKYYINLDNTAVYVLSMHMFLFPSVFNK